MRSSSEFRLSEEEGRKLTRETVGMCVRTPRLILQGEERIRIEKIITDALAVRPRLPDYKNL